MAKDIFAGAVKNGLLKQNWQITHDPLSIKVGGVDMSIDLGAEKLIAAQKQDTLIAVEIKSFIKASAISEYHTALGQYLNYRHALTIAEPERILYLAVPIDVYDGFFTRPFLQESLKQNGLKLIVYNPYNEVIEQWIS